MFVFLSNIIVIKFCNSLDINASSFNSRQCRIGPLVVSAHLAGLSSSSQQLKLGVLVLQPSIVKGNDYGMT